MKSILPKTAGIRTGVCIVASIAIPALLCAQDETKNASAAEIEINATKLTIDPFKQPYALYQHDREELDSGTGRTLLDRIDYGPGVIMQQTGPGQTSPYIRGLTGKQSLLLFDGVRLSHTAMRSGPNQYSALIPDMSVASVDALLGSSGAVNGSDGLTGALDIRLEQAGRGVLNPASPWLTARVDTASGTQTAVGVDGSASSLSYSVEGSFFDFHDRAGGKDASGNIYGGTADDRIPNTAYEQSAVAARAAYEGIDNRIVDLAFGHTRQDDAPRPDGYYENSGKSDRISRYYDPETFSYLHLRDSWAPEDYFFDKLVTTAWWHQQDEQQKREDLTGSMTVYRRREYDDKIDSIGVESQATSVLGDHQLTYGALAMFEKTSNAYREYRNLNGPDPIGATIYNQGSWATNTTVTDGAEYNTSAIYAQDLWQLTEMWNLLAGVRYTYVGWSFDVAESSTDDLTGSLRASCQFSDDMMTFLGVSKSFRAPNLTDLDGATDRASSGSIAFGNPELDPELGYTAEAGWRYAKGRDQLGASAFYTIIDNVIQTVYPSDNGPGSTENGESAYLQGVELQADYGVPVADLLGCERVAVVGSASYVDSEQEVPQADGSILKEPISRANRFYGIAGLKCELNRNWWTRLQMRFHDDYGRGDITSEDATDVRLTVPGGENGTMPGFEVFDLAGGWVNDKGDRWATMTLENIGDKTYRQLGSGADAPGFNVVLAGGTRF